MNAVSAHSISIGSTPAQGNENNQYLISSSKNRTHNLSRLQSHLRAPAPRLAGDRLGEEMGYTN